jgi:alpha-ketoglutarate-dependent taurine dioxygenase
MRPDPDLSLADWAKGNLSLIDANLLRYGAILFQAAGVTTQEDFEHLIETLFPETLSYVERSTPRTRVTDRLYTSTEYPASESIALHNESSYASVWPGKVCFFCLSPADQDGETPLADVRKVYERIDPEIIDAFNRREWMLVRNYHDGMGLTWQSAFQTGDKSVVEEYCRSGQIEFEWIGGDRLRTRQVRPAMARHPNTGEMVWFNHIVFWHITGLDDETREVMTSLYAAEDLPYNTYYGDGSEIEPDVIDHMREAYEKERVAFPWRQGDVLLLDNMLVAHGRNPFKGPRKILVAMAEPQTNRNL